jgi:hypothetical protein
MYLIKLPEEMVRELYLLREELKQEGVKTSIAELVRVAVKEKIFRDSFLCEHKMPKQLCEFCKEKKRRK